MKRILCIFLSITFLLTVTSSAFALIRTRNVDIDEGGFGYKVAYGFATNDVGLSRSAVEIPNDATLGVTTGHNFYYTMPFKGSIVGVSIAANQELTTGGLTADVTINGTITGVRVALDGGAATLWSRSGLKADHKQFNFQTIAFDDDSPEDWGGTCGLGSQACVTGYEYGRATPLVAGDRIGVRVTTSSNLNPVTIDFNVTVMVLQ